MNHFQPCHKYVPNPSATGSARSIPNFTQPRKVQFSCFGQQTGQHLGKKKPPAIRAKSATDEAQKQGAFPPWERPCVIALSAEPLN
jgi:hypothetical protein